MIGFCKLGNLKKLNMRKLIIGVISVKIVSILTHNTGYKILSFHWGKKIIYTFCLNFPTKIFTF